MVRPPADNPRRRGKRDSQNRSHGEPDRRTYGSTMKIRPIAPIRLLFWSPPRGLDESAVRLVLPDHLPHSIQLDDPRRRRQPTSVWPFGQSLGADRPRHRRLPEQVAVGVVFPHAVLSEARHQDALVRRHVDAGAHDVRAGDGKAVRLLAGRVQPATEAVVRDAGPSSRRDAAAHPARRAPAAARWRPPCRRGQTPAGGCGRRRRCDRSAGAARRPGWRAGPSPTAPCRRRCARRRACRRTPRSARRRPTPLARRSALAARRR